MCRVLGVSRSGYYAWARRPTSQRDIANAALAQEVVKVHEASRRTYGSPRVFAELRRQGSRVGRHRVARMMRKQGLVGRMKRRFRRTTDSAHEHPIAENLLARQFQASAPGQAWVADITYLWTDEGWLHLAVVIDLYSRRVVGWAMEDHLRTELALKALRMALATRPPQGQLIHHSDRGTQYASNDYRGMLEANGVTASMSRKGNCWDNAVAESFFGTLEIELVDGARWITRDQAKTAVFEYIEVFYNRQRLRSTNGYRSPAEYEQVAV